MENKGINKNKPTIPSVRESQSLSPITPHTVTSKSKQGIARPYHFRFDSVQSSQSDGLDISRHRTSTIRKSSIQQSPEENLTEMRAKQEIKDMLR